MRDFGKYVIWLGVILSVLALMFIQSSVGGPVDPGNSSAPQVSPEKLVDANTRRARTTGLQESLTTQRRLLKRSQNRINSLEKDLSVLEDALKKRRKARKSRKTKKQQR